MIQLNMWWYLQMAGIDLGKSFELLMRLDHELLMVRHAGCYLKVNPLLRFGNISHMAKDCS